MATAHEPKPSDAASELVCNEEFVQHLQSTIHEKRVVVRHCAKTNMDVEIAYHTFGEPCNPAVLLVMGMNGPGALWDEDFCETLARRGYFVIRYDNRDIGLSTKFDKCGSPGLLQLLFPSCCCCCTVPYLLTDMAADGIALLDALKIPKAHVVGVSMGGMIAQLMAAEYPHRVATLTSMMSTTGSPEQVEPSLSLKLFLSKRPNSNSVEDLAAFQVRFVKRCGGPRPFDVSRCYSKSVYLFRRSAYNNGAFRHAGAIVYSPSRLESLKKLTVPALVIHGDRDELVPLQNGIQTHEAIPGSRLVVVPNMGHVIFPEDVGTLVDEIDRHARQVDAAPKRESA